MYEYFDFDYKNTIFEWDDEKSASNFVKHGIRFETASKVFADENKLIRYDEEHPYEDRYDVLGKVGKILFVVCTFKKGNVVRIISARLATEPEKASMSMAKVTMNSLPPELTPEEIAELEAAEKMQIVFDEDCPEMTGEMLKQFHKMNTVTIEISPSSMKKIKSLGANYSKILSNLLDLALNDAELVKKCM